MSRPAPRVGLAGPDALSAQEAVDAFATALGRPFQVRHEPRVAMRVGRTLARQFKREIASVVGMALVGDLQDTSVGDEGFRGPGG